MKEVMELQENYGQILRKYFFEHVLFSIQWWFLLSVTIGLWIIWAFLVDKQRLKIILLIGLFTSIIALVADELGLSYVLWSYPYYLLPYTSTQYPIDAAVIPVFYMLLYQYFSKWKPYLATLTIITLFSIFLAEPLFIKLGIYIPLNEWKHWYSAPGYMLIGIFAKIFGDKINGTATSERKELSPPNKQ